MSLAIAVLLADRLVDGWNVWEKRKELCFTIWIKTGNKIKIL